MESRCKIIRCESVLCFALVCFLIINYKPFSTAQPLLNSLAVMLRARPPWPALYPAMKEPHFYSSSVLNPLITSAARQQGILVAHPITNVNYVRPQFQLAQTQLLSPVINSNAQNIQNDLVSAYSNSFQPTNEYPVEVHLEQNEKGSENSIPSTMKPISTKPMDFRPSPQLFDHNQYFGDNRYDSFSNNDAAFQVSEAQIQPKYESGFQPLGFTQNKLSFGDIAKDYYNKNYSNYYNNTFMDFAKPMSKKKHSKPAGTISPFRKDRQVVSAVVSKSEVSVKESISSKTSRMNNNNNETAQSSKEKNTISSTSSSELIEDWIKVKELKNLNTNKPSQKFPVYKRRYSRPVKCQFHRYGFCKIDSHYPKADVEKVASRCYALLTHIISPKINYGLSLSKNGTILERFPPGKNQQKGWNWRSYKGKPICDTLELNFTPGFVILEDGTWVVVLQTAEWKQEVQISLCASSQMQCTGTDCSRPSTLLPGTKCVQRFAAQRLAVMDSNVLGEDNCPVIKSVFLPSACICLSEIENTNEKPYNQTKTSSSNQRPIFYPEKPTKINDTTYMIVTEKFSINESS